MVTDILKLGGAALMAVSAAMILKSQRPELALYVSLAACIILLGAALSAAGEIKRQAEELMTKYSLNTQGIGTVVRIAGVAYAAQLCSDICRDAGEGAVASRIELAGRLMMLLAALPMVLSAVEAICGLLA